MLLINAYRMMGDFEAAESAMREVDGLLTVLRSGRGWAEFGYHWTYQAERARGEYLQAQGKHIPAELSFIRALSAVNSRIKQMEESGNSNSTRRVHDVSNFYFSKAVVLQRLGNSLVAQRKLVEAEYYLRLSLKEFLRLSSRNSTTVSGVLNSLAYAVSEQGRFNEAVILAQYALQINQEAGVRPSSSIMIYSRRAYAASLVGNEQYAKAAEQFNLLRLAVNADVETAQKFKNLDRRGCSIFDKM